MLGSQAGFNPSMICLTLKRCSCCKRLAFVEFGTLLSWMLRSGSQLRSGDRKNSRDSKKVKSKSLGPSRINEFTSKSSGLLLIADLLDVSNMSHSICKAQHLSQPPRKSVKICSGRMLPRSLYNDNNPRFGLAVKVQSFAFSSKSDIFATRTAGAKRNWQMTKDTNSISVLEAPG